jgi:GH43 family beta-xylosidase
MQRFTWRPDGSPDFGEPVASGVRLPVPSGEPCER